MDRSPEVQDVAFRAAFGIKALKHVLRHVHRKRTTAVAWLAMDRAATVPLGAPPEIGQAAQMGEHLFHRHLPTQGFEIDLFGARRRGGLARCSFVGQRRVDGRRRRGYFGIGCGDRLLFGLSFPIAARGLLLFARCRLVPRVMVPIKEGAG